MIYDFGFLMEHMQNETLVNKHVDMLDTKFHLVMVAEYFDQSLIILRDLLMGS